MSELISIIAPLLNEEATVHELVTRVRQVMETHHLAYELILVDDGSRDRTFALISEEADKDSRVVGLRLRCRSGQTAALRAGIDLARGEICITMDGDLQHDPKYIPELVQQIHAGYDLVCSHRFERNDGFLRRIPSRIANALARLLSGLQVKDFGSTYRAYRTEVVKDLPIYGEMHRFIPVFVSMMTDRVTEIPIHVEPRKHGRSKYGIGRTFRVISDLVVLLFFGKFFNRPVHIFGYIALSVGIPGVAILAYLTCGKIFAGLAIANYAPLFMLGVLLTAVAGQLFTTGIVCEYLIRVYYNSERRTSYSIAETTIEETIDEENDRWAVVARRGLAYAVAGGGGRSRGRGNAGA